MTPHLDRPLKDKSTEELLKLFDKKCLEQGRLSSYGNIMENSSMPSTFLKTGATQATIDQLAIRFKGPPQNFSDGLPSDYADFLKVTNGIYEGNADDGSAENIFADADLVEAEDDRDDLWSCELLTPEIFSKLGLKAPEVDWPSMGPVINVGRGGDEGCLWLVSPTKTKEAVEAFMDAYWDADEKGRQALETAVKALYGSVSDMRKLKYSCFRMFHWAAELEVFASFKHMLEDFIVSMDKDPPTADGEVNDGDGEEGGGEEVREEEEEYGDEAEEPKDVKKQSKATFQIPKGKANSLKDLQLLFTGTFDMDRKTCEATAKQYGAKIISKMENTDYIILGAAAGPKKLETIREKGLKTISQQGFFDLLQGKTPQQVQQEVVDSKPDSKAGNSASAAKVFASRTGKAAEAKKQMPEGKANALAGLKIIFTGTLETMDRATAKKAAEAHGAKVITKLEDTDFIVLGVKAGPKKLQEISDKGLKTVSEAEFGEMLSQGQDGDEEDAASSEKEGKKRAAKKGSGSTETGAAPATKRSKRGK